MDRVSKRTFILANVELGVWTKEKALDFLGVSSRDIEGWAATLHGHGTT